MRLALASLLVLSILGAVHCAELGTEENPFPEDHEGTEDEEGADEYHEEDDTESEEEEGDDGKLHHYEDKGEHDTLTEKHLRDLHKKLDHNGDGKVHVDEVLKYAEVARKSVAQKEIASVFDEIESTKDGYLSFDEHLAEIAEYHEGEGAEKEAQKQADIAKFRAADTNGDDKLDKDELVHLMHPETHPEVLDIHCNEEMRKRDTDKDGRLTKKEWEKDATQGEHAAHMGHEHDPSADFDRLDENHDGHIDMDELRHWESGRFHTKDAMKKLLELVDKDGDNHMTADELAKAADNIDGHDAHPHLLDWVFHDDL